MQRRNELEAIVARFGLPPEAEAALARLLPVPADTPGDSGATLPPEDDTEEASAVASSDRGGRYVDLGAIGAGGMAEVRRVHDVGLERVVAMKVLRADLAHQAGHATRFLEEARTIAQLDHPSIVPVYDLGFTDDGRAFFTMRPIRGRTFADVLAAVNGDGRPRGDWARPRAGFSLHRLVTVLQKVCDALAFAHSRGVVHRDVKPANIMLGEFGEVVVLDWGLARVVEGEGVVGVAGTPGYMAPEQADGRPVTFTADVWSLGMLLAEVLHGKLRAPDGRVVLPAELVDVCRRALEEVPARRYRDAGPLAADLGSWLEGARQLEQADAMVAEADALLPAIARLRSGAQAARAEARDLASRTPTHAPVAEKLPIWALEDEAASRTTRADGATVQYVQLLRAALTHAPQHAGAHRGLADYFRSRQALAEQERDAAESARAQAFLRVHDDGRHGAWLQGDGAVTLVTDPPGAEVELLRFAERERRLVADPVGSLGVTPLRAVTLPMGSWLLVLRLEGHATVRYPVRLLRQEHWEGVRPGGIEPFPIRLPRAGELGAGEVYVPAGWFTCGGDPHAFGGVARRRAWVDALAMRRFPVTVGEYVAFLNRAVDAGGADQAERLAPRARPTEEDEVGAVALERDAAGRFVCSPAGERTPVTLVTWHAAMRYAADHGGGFRLPTSLEWEKAARGVDERVFPWGHHLDPTFCNIVGSAPEPRLAPVDAFPVDESVYGVRGLGGNAQDWCLDPWLPDGHPLEGDAARAGQGDPGVAPGWPRVYKGGFWSGGAHFARAAARPWNAPTTRYASLGFRLARPL